MIDAVQRAPVPLRVGLIGYGLAGRVFHAPLITASPGLELAAVVTAAPPRAGQAAADHPGAYVTGNVDEVLEPSAVDLVVVATPNDTHVPLASRAVAAGTPVVVDKPLAVNLTDAKRLVAAAAEAAVPLSVFQNRRWDGDFLTVRQLIDQGRLGQVHRFESRFERWRPDVDRGRWREDPGAVRGGGLLLDLGAHLVDQALTLFGPVATVYAELGCRRAGGVVDDDVFVALDHRGGTRSHLWAGALVASRGARFTVLGNRAGYRVEGLDVQESQLRDGMHPADPRFGVVEPSGWGVVGTPGAAVPVPTVAGSYRSFYSELAAALVAGDPPPVPAAEVLGVMEVLDAARRSATRHTVVKLEGEAPSGSAGGGSAAAAAAAPPRQRPARSELR